MTLVDDVTVLGVAAAFVLGISGKAGAVVDSFLCRQRANAHEHAVQGQIASVNLERSLHAAIEGKDHERAEQLKDLMHQQQVEIEATRLENLQHNREQMRRAFAAKEAAQDYTPLPSPHASEAQRAYQQASNLRLGCPPAPGTVAGTPSSDDIPFGCSLSWDASGDFIQGTAPVDAVVRWRLQRGFTGSFCYNREWYTSDGRPMGGP